MNLEKRQNNGVLNIKTIDARDLATRRIPASEFNHRPFFHILFLPGIIPLVACFCGPRDCRQRLEGNKESNSIHVINWHTIRRLLIIQYSEYWRSLSALLWEEGFDWMISKKFCRQQSLSRISIRVIYGTHINSCGNSYGPTRTRFLSTTDLETLDPNVCSFYRVNYGRLFFRNIRISHV